MGRTLRLAVGLLATLIFPTACSKSKAAQGADAAPAPLLAASTASALSTDALTILHRFEGEIDAVVKEAKSPDPLSIALRVKNDRLRVNLPEKLARRAGPMGGAPNYVIFDAPAKSLSLVSDAQKQVMVFDLDKNAEALKGLGGAPSASTPAGTPKAPAAKLTKTGRVESVAGISCEDWDVTTDHREASLCVAEQGVSWLRLPLTGIPTERLWMTELLDGKHFPLRFVGYAKDGSTEEARVEVTKLDKKTLPASDFETPPGYQVIDLAQMLQGLRGLPGAGVQGGGQRGAGTGMAQKPSMH